MELNQRGFSQQYLLGFIFLATAAVLAFFAIQNEEGEHSYSSRLPRPVPANSAEAEKVVNKYLKETNKAIEMQQLQSKIQNQFVVPKVGEVITSHAGAKRKDSIHVGSGEVTQLGERGYDTVTPSAQIQSDLAEQQRLEEYDQQFREEYIRQFVANDRKNGWKLVVDENGVIKSATPLNVEEKPRLFDGPSRLSNQ